MSKNPRTGEEAIKRKTEVYCTVQVAGMHNWPDCPFDEVDYLRVPHRHIFYIKAYKEVTHSDRDVEFIMLKNAIEHYLVDKYRQSRFTQAGTHSIHGGVLQFGAMSCEMIAEELIDEFALSQCEVSEDNENGAIVRNI